MSTNTQDKQMREIFKSVNKLLMTIIRDYNSNKIRIVEYRRVSDSIYESGKGTEMSIMQNFKEDMEIIYELIYKHQGEISEEDIEDLSGVRSELFNLSKNKDLDYTDVSLNQLTEFRKELESIVIDPGTSNFEDNLVPDKIIFTGGSIEVQGEGKGYEYRLDPSIENALHLIEDIGREIPNLYKEGMLNVSGKVVPIKTVKEAYNNVNSNNEVNASNVISKYFETDELHFEFLDKDTEALTYVVKYLKDLSMTSKDAIIEGMYDYLLDKGIDDDNMDDELMKFLSTFNKGKSILELFKGKEQVASTQEVVTPEYTLPSKVSITYKGNKLIEIDKPNASRNNYELPEIVANFYNAIVEVDRNITGIYEDGHFILEDMRVSADLLKGIELSFNTNAGELVKVYTGITNVDNINEGDIIGDILEGLKVHKYKDSLDIVKGIIVNYVDPTGERSVTSQEDFESKMSTLLFTHEVITDLKGYFSKVEGTMRYLNSSPYLESKLSEKGESIIARVLQLDSTQKVPESILPDEFDEELYSTLSIPEKVKYVDESLHNSNPLNIVKGMGGGSNIDSIVLALKNLDKYDNYVEATVEEALKASNNNVRRSLYILISAYMVKHKQEYLQNIQPVKNAVTICFAIIDHPEFNTINHLNVNQCYKLVESLGLEIA